MLFNSSIGMSRSQLLCGSVRALTSGDGSDDQAVGAIPRGGIPELNVEQPDEAVPFVHPVGGNNPMDEGVDENQLHGRDDAAQQSVHNNNNNNNLINRNRRPDPNVEVHPLDAEMEAFDRAGNGRDDVIKHNQVDGNVNANVAQENEAMFDFGHFSLKQNSDLFANSEDMQKQADEIYAEQWRVKSKAIVPDNELSHLKSSSNRRELVNSPWLYAKWQVRKDLQKHFVNIIYRHNSRLHPVSSDYITEIGAAILNKKTNLNLPIMNMIPSLRNIIAKSVYGASLGLYDLLYFVPTTHKQLDFIFDYSGKLSSSEKESTPSRVVVRMHSPVRTPDEPSDSISGVFHITEFSFGSIAEADFTSFISNSSSYTRSSILSVISSMFDIELDIEVDFVVDGESERRALLFKNEKVTEYSDGFKVKGNIVDILTWDNKSIVLINTLLALYIWPTVHGYTADDGHTALGEASKYVATVVMHYVKSRIRSTSSDVQIANLKFHFIASRKFNSFSELVSLYKGFVDTGVMVPLGPIHYLFYLQDDYEQMPLWYEFILYSSLCCPELNPMVKSVMPKLNDESKNQLKLYSIQNKFRLNSSYYNSDVSLPFQQELTFHITYRRFLQEMFVRIMLKSATPDYMLFVSAGQWVGNNSSSTVIHPTSLHPVFAKFGIHDVVAHAFEVTNDLLMDTKDFKVPYYFKTRTRITEKMPDFYVRYLESFSQK
jgi:hypothetical protein